MVRIESLLNLCTYAACLLGIAPLFPFLATGTQIVFALALAAGVVLDRGRRQHLNPTLATVLSILVFVFYGLQISLASLVEPIVNILALLLAIRLVTEKSGRNYLQIFVLAVFALASSTLLTLSAPFFLFLTLQIVFVTVGLVLLSFFTVDRALALPRRQLKTLLGTALILPAVSLVLMLVFFVILPRTRTPLWNFLNPAAAARVGFSDEVSPGSVASVVAVEQTAFRVESPELDRDQLYWRGIVLNALEDNTWSRVRPPESEHSRVVGGQRVALIFYPLTRGENYLLTLDLPQDVAGIRTRASVDRVFRTRKTIDKRDRYRVTAAIGGTLQASPPPAGDLYLEVPGRTSPRVRAVARRLRAEADTAAERIALLEDFFTAQDLTYATTDLPASADPVDEFLFEKKKGYCEYFASSFALLLRLAQVPARLVGGYYGGEYNELGGYYVIGEETAHVWVEALVEDGRWLRLDPSRLANNAGTALLSSRGRGLGSLRRMVDALDYFWSRMVINYDLGQQMEVLRQTGTKLEGIKTGLQLPRTWVLFAAVGGGVATVIVLCRRGRRSPRTRLLERFLRQVRKKHRPRALPPAVGLMELAEEVDDPLCREFARIYGRALYRDRPLSKEERARLRQLIARLKRAPSGKGIGPQS